MKNVWDEFRQQDPATKSYTTWMLVAAVISLLLCLPLNLLVLWLGIQILKWLGYA